MDRGYKVFYREANQLVEDIAEARELRAPSLYRKQLKAADIVLIDDQFLPKLSPQAGDELAEILMRRYQNATTIVTSNRPLEDWARLLGDTAVVTRCWTG